MEDLGEILKRLADTNRVNGGARDDDALPPPDDDADACPVCQGRLWLTIDAPVGHPDFGRAVQCGCQLVDAASERRSRLQRYSNLGPLASKTFGSLDPSGRTDDAESKRLFAAAYEAALAYAEEPLGWLAFTGPNGAGKTHLAAAIANHCIEQSRPVFFVHVPDLLDDLRSTYAPTSELTYSELFEQVSAAPLLILDGLGSQSPTAWAQEKLQQIFNRRANAELPTIVTTAAELREIDPYIASRLADPELGRVVELRGRSVEPSRRLGRVPPEMLERMTFDTFDTRGNDASAEQRASLERAFATARGWADAPDGWLTMFGETGTGKTHLAVAIAAVRVERGLPTFFAFVPELMDYLRQTFDPNSGLAYDRVFDDVKNAPLLILDDLGGEHYSDWANEKLYQIIVHRHNLRMPVFITTSKDVPSISGPIMSRIQDPSSGFLTRMDAPDYRVKRPHGSTRQGVPGHTRRRRGR